MDFHSLLSAAKQNISTSKNKQNYYSTSFAPPKKETKEKRLSNNIKKFLEKQKEEDEEKKRIAREKKLELLAKRDPKIQRKIEKSLKVIKSSKKYYTGDKTLDENTAVTLESEHPDEDDYGFASSTSDIYHQKLMEKYQKLPVEDKLSRIFKTKKSKVASTQSNTEEDDHHFKNGHRDRVSKIKGSETTTSANKSSQSHSSDKKSSNNSDVKAKPKLKAAPPVDFHALLKLAEKKQHEEIMIDVPSKKEPERLLTSKEKKEMEEIEAARKAKLKPPTSTAAIPKIQKIGAIPKLNESSKNDKNNNSNTDKLIKTPPQQSSGSKLRDALSKPTLPPPPPSVPLKSQPIPSTSKSSTSLKAREISLKTPSSSNGVVKKPVVKNGSKPVISKEVVTKTREFPPKDLQQKTREFPPRDLQQQKTREFPPRDLKRPRELAMKKSKIQHQQMAKKRRIIDDDDSEYDSEMDDFIDDSDANVDVSSAIKSIFGYDKSRYRDEDFDDREMESDYRTVMKEEFISKKIGLMEDLEDMRREQEELERKKMKKKKRV